MLDVNLTLVVKPDTTLYFVLIMWTPLILSGVGDSPA
jgi:hypothetical protein